MVPDLIFLLRCSLSMEMAARVHFAKPGKAIDTMPNIMEDDDE